MTTVINTRNQKTIVTDLELADKIKTRLVGLMGRKSFKNGAGLLIKKSGNSIHTCFMKFPIDLIFIGAKGEVKYLVKNMKPWRIVIAPLIRQTDCLELPAGTIAESQVKIGDILSVKA